MEGKRGGQMQRSFSTRISPLLPSLLSMTVFLACLAPPACPGSVDVLVAGREGARDESRRGLRASNEKQEGLLSYLRLSGALRSSRVEESLRVCDRSKFCCQDRRCDPYLDYPIPIGKDATISEPWVHSLSLEMLSARLFPGARALDVGSGSGQVTAAMAYLIGRGGEVHGIERIRSLARRSVENICNVCDSKTCAPVKIIEGNVLLGEIPSLSYDAIHVGAAVSHDVLKTQLLPRLNPGGRLVCPLIENNFNEQSIYCIDRLQNGHYKWIKSGVKLRMMTMKDTVPPDYPDRSIMPAIASWRCRLTPRPIAIKRLKRHLRTLNNDLFRQS